jgi:hypothetical protein
MKKYLVTMSFIVISKMVLSQDTTININSYVVIPDSAFDREEILISLIKQKAYDYWEYRYVCQTQSDDYAYDSVDYLPYKFYKYDILSHGQYENVNDSIKLSKISSKEGFWWVPPAGGCLYLIAIKSNKIDIVVNKEELFEFLKPFDSIEKFRLYYDNYGLLKYKRNIENIELIVYDIEKYIKYYKNGNDHYNVFESFYLRISRDGRLYKKRIGEYHLKNRRFI